MATTPGRLILESIVPAEFRDHIGPDQDIGSKEIDGILARVADRRPDLYREISHKLLRLGMKGSVETDTSFTLDDLETSLDKTAIRRRVQAEVDAIRGIPDLDEAERNRRILEVYGKYAQELPQMVYDQALGEGSGLARMVAAGARGNKSQLNSSIGMDWAVADSKGRQLPIPIAHGYSEGLTPAEYFATAYGTRLGLISTKFSVQDGGYFCLAGDTLVRTPDGGRVPISELNEGDWVVGATMSGECLPVRVRRVFRNGIRSASRFVFRVGRSRTLRTSIIGTDAHEVMARYKTLDESESREAGVQKGRITGWRKVPLGRARKGFSMMVSGGCEPLGAVEEPLAFLIGYALGDGMMRAHKFTISVGDQDLEMVDYLSGILDSVGYDFRRVNRKALSYEYAVVEREPSRYFSRDENGGFVKGEKNPLRVKLEDLGIWGKLAHEKDIPEVAIRKWDNKSLWGLVGGLIGSDGCISDSNLSSVPNVIFAVTSEAMCRSLFEILTRRLGVHCLPPSVRRIKGTRVGSVGPHPDRDYVSNHDLWVLRISHFDSVRRIARNIELPGRKGDALRKWESEAPAEDPSGRGGFAYHFLERELVGDIEVFDIEVDHPDHLYVLDNGMVVSNSKQISAAASDLIVTEDDCGTDNGIPSDPGDKENVGAVLARDAGGVKAGTILTPKILAEIARANGGKRIVTRSPVSCQAKGGGLCSKCSGVREDNRLPAIGDPVGTNAASGLSMPVQQALLCLAKGTMVRMADGSEKAIEDVRPGDWVLGSDKSGRIRPVRVVRTYDNGPREVYRTDFSREDVVLESTLEHQVLAGDDRWDKTPVADVSGEDGSVWAVVHTADGPVKTPRTGESLHLGLVPTYDIEVDHPDHLFVLANGLIVGNSTKHSAGVVSGGGASQVTGFPQIDALVQVPSTYPNAATLANLDGKVDSVEPAPQGGTWVTVAGERHYVPQDREIKVKPGDVIEAGDVLSSGTPNPAEIVRHKGVGAGRAYFVKTFLQTLKDNGTTADRRNTEVIARALINHVRIGDEGVSDRYLPDDIAEYSEMARTYVKPDGSRRMKVREARGKYLQAPVLHYTIGTRIVPSVEKDLEDLDIGEVDVSDDPPPFSPEMIRAMDNPAHKDDLLTHAGQSYVKRNLMADVQSGRAGSDLHGRHIAPAIAKGVELGRPPKGTPGY